MQIRSFSGPYFPAFGMNTDIYSGNLLIQPECGKIRTRKTPYLDTFHAVDYFYILKRDELSEASINFNEMK